MIGAGGIGFDVAEYLLHHNDEDEDGHDKRADEVDVNQFLADWGVDGTNESRGGLLNTSESTSLNSTGRQIFMLQRKGKLGKGPGKTTGWIRRATLAKSKSVKILDAVTYEKIDEYGNLYILQNKSRPDKKRDVLEVDNRYQRKI